MCVYARTKRETAASLAYCAMSALAGWFVAVALRGHTLLLFLLPLACALAAAWLFLVSGNIKIRLESGGAMHCYRNGRLRHTFFVPDCEISRPAPRKKRRWLAPAIRTLVVTPPGAAKPVTLDCECLGEEQFERLCESIQEIKQTAGTKGV